MVLKMPTTASQQDSISIFWTSKFSSQVPNPPSSWTSQLLMTFYCTMVSDAPWRMQPPSFKKIVTIGFIAKEKIEILPNWSPGLVKGFRALVTKLEVVGAPGNASAALLMVKRPPNDINRLCHREGHETRHRGAFRSASASARGFAALVGSCPSP